jgi:hypothetical protein
VETPNREHTTDYAGNKLVVGDRIACAFRIAASCELRTGTIEAFDGRSGGHATISVRWDENQLSHTPENSVTQINDNPRRIVRISH